MKNSKLFKQSGQALISLLFVAVIFISIMSAAAILVFGNMQSASITEQGTYAYYVAESGIEEGILRLLRDPSYTGTSLGLPLIVGQGQAVIQVSDGIIISIGTYNNSIRKLQVQTMYNNGVLTVSSWKEVW